MKFDNYHIMLNWARDHVRTLPWYDHRDVVHTAFVHWYDKYGYNLFRSSDMTLVRDVIRRTADVMNKRYRYHPRTLKLLAGML